MTTPVQAPAYTPTYRPGVTLEGPAAEDAMSVMRRLADLYRNGTTDRVASQWAEPIENYGNPELFAREQAQVFKRIPLPVGLSCELVGPNTYKSVTIAGVPLVITRDAGGAIHAALNICRHRSALVCAEGIGTARRLTCPYHAWSYELDGRLAAVYGDKTFGEFDHAERGLISLPCEERAGVIFAGLTPDIPWDLDTWLGDMLPVLASLKLDEAYHFSTRVLQGPNWKVVVDGYLESYHFQSLHRYTVFMNNMSNLATWDPYGPHQRISFALKRFPDAVEKDPATWEPTDVVSPIVWVFPGLAISGSWRNQSAISFVFPGSTVGASRTEQLIILRNPPADEQEAELAAHTRDWFHDVVLEEDYGTGFGVQSGLEHMAGHTQLFGRNEPGVQHFHKMLDTLTASGGVLPS